jgi:hypothetical protein
MSGHPAQPITDERLRNTRNWAAARIGQLSGADVIVAACDEALAARCPQALAQETPIDDVIDFAKRGGLPVCLALVAEIERLRYDLKIQRAVVDIAYLPARRMAESRDHHFARAEAAEAELAALRASVKGENP